MCADKRLVTVFTLGLDEIMPLGSAWDTECLFIKQLGLVEWETLDNFLFPTLLSGAPATLATPQVKPIRFAGSQVLSVMVESSPPPTSKARAGLSENFNLSVSHSV